MARRKLEAYDTKIAHQTQIRLGLTTGFAVTRNIYREANTTLLYAVINGVKFLVKKDTAGWYVLWPVDRGIPTSRHGNAPYRIAGPPMWWEERRAWRPH